MDTHTQTHTQVGITTIYVMVRLPSKWEGVKFRVLLFLFLLSFFVYLIWWSVCLYVYICVKNITFGNYKHSYVLWCQKNLSNNFWTYSVFLFYFIIWLWSLYLSWREGCKHCNKQTKKYGIFCILESMYCRNCVYNMCFNNTMWHTRESDFTDLSLAAQWWTWSACCDVGSCPCCSSVESPLHSAYWRVYIIVSWVLCTHYIPEILKTQ